MNEVWICAAGDKKLTVRCLSILTAWEVRQFAAKKLGVDPPSLESKLSTDGAPSGSTVIEVRWTGDDYAHGGTTKGRRLQERALGAQEWTDA